MINKPNFIASLKKSLAEQEETAIKQAEITFEISGSNESKFSGRLTDINAKKLLQFFDISIPNEKQILNLELKIIFSNEAQYSTSFSSKPVKVVQQAPNNTNEKTNFNQKNHNKNRR